MKREREGCSADFHPTSEEVQAFLRGELFGLRANRVLWHWLTDCSACRDCIAPLASALHAVQSPPAVNPDAYEEPIERAFREACRADRDRKRHEKQVKVGLDALRKGLEPGLGLRIDGPARVEAQLAYSWELRFSAPREMLRHAERATVEALACLNAQNCGSEDARHDILCRAFAELANAFRVNSRYRSAQEALGRAFACFGHGTRNELLKAHVLSIQARLATDQRRYDLAQVLEDRALEIYQRNRLSHLTGQTLISKAKFFIEADEPARGIPLLRKALTLLVPGRDPALELAACFNLAWASAESGDFKEARKRVWGLAHKFEERGQTMNALRVRWLEGKIHLGLGDYEKAARDFATVRDAFASHDLAYDTALVSLELAVALREVGNWAEAEERLLESLATFGRLALNDYFRLTLTAFQECFERRQVAAKSLIEMVAILRQVHEEAQRDERVAHEAWKWAEDREERLERRDRGPRSTE